MLFTFLQRVEQTCDLLSDQSRPAFASDREEDGLEANGNSYREHFTPNSQQK